MRSKLGRLQSKREIQQVIKNRQYQARTPLLQIVGRNNSLTLFRVVAVTPRRLGSAVKRNKIRRRIYSIFDDLKGKIKAGVDVVVFPFAGSVDAEYSSIAVAVNRVLLKAGLVQNGISS